MLIYAFMYMTDMCEMNDSNDTKNGGEIHNILLLDTCAVKQDIVV